MTASGSPPAHVLEHSGHKDPVDTFEDDFYDFVKAPALLYRR